MGNFNSEILLHKTSCFLIFRKKRKKEKSPLAFLKLITISLEFLTGNGRYKYERALDGKLFLNHLLKIDFMINLPITAPKWKCSRGP
jgi:hypothetical protein